MILAFDGALGAFSVALLDPTSGETPRTAHTSGSDALERGLGLIAEILDATPWSSIDRIGVGLGPGSFTGLRIAVSYAKAIAFARAIPLIGVSSYDLVEDEGVPTPTMAVVVGRPGVVCARLRSIDGEMTIACGHIDEVAERFSSILGAPSQAAEITLSGEKTVHEFAANLRERGFRISTRHPSLRPPALAVAHRAAVHDATEPPAALRPDYGELPAVSMPKPSRP
ncbi:MAG TPA: tRNA (adenosine(37)-N6)-threonylcarbamoyltransferase complex dimerization subunit type 1 TsaB [Candidatus Baltobacteraceae bacterium]|jgi:tRNA threonylcarbamoyl adenosine modification protein YeaZ|nr:tRNA (adenosine(37)-N6)-threonylcarbamoyltransferase complex dimerization subunit type 1 TsaB [Candidatus Baltobacteraceae bacterium]